MVIVYVWYIRVCAISKILSTQTWSGRRKEGGNPCSVHLYFLEIQDVNSYQGGLCLLLDGSRTSSMPVLGDRTWGQVGETTDVLT